MDRCFIYEMTTADRKHFIISNWKQQIVFLFWRCLSLFPVVSRSGLSFLLLHFLSSISLTLRSEDNSVSGTVPEHKLVLGLGGSDNSRVQTGGVRPEPLTSLSSDQVFIHFLHLPLVLKFFYLN